MIINYDTSIVICYNAGSIIEITTLA